MHWCTGTGARCTDAIASCTGALVHMHGHRAAVHGAGDRDDLEFSMFKLVRKLRKPKYPGVGKKGTDTGWLWDTKDPRPCQML